MLNSCSALQYIQTVMLRYMVYSEVNRTMNTTLSEDIKLLSTSASLGLMSRHTVHTAYWSAILQTALVTHSLTVLNQLHSLQLQIVNMQLYSTASQPNKYSHQQFLFLTLFHIT